MMSIFYRSPCCLCFRSTDVYCPADDCSLPYSTSSVTHSPIIEKSFSCKNNNKGSITSENTGNKYPHVSNIENGTISPPIDEGVDLRSNLNTPLSQSKIIVQGEQMSPFFVNNNNAESQNRNITHNSKNSDAEMTDILSEAIMAEIDIDDSNLDDFRYHSPPPTAANSVHAKKVRFSPNEKTLHTYPVNDDRCDSDAIEKENIQNPIPSERIGIEPETIRMLLQEKIPKFHFNVSTEIFQRFLHFHKNNETIETRNNNDDRFNTNRIDNDDDMKKSPNRFSSDPSYVDKRLSLSALRSARIVTKTIPIYEENILVNTPKSSNGSVSSSNSNSNSTNSKSPPDVSGFTGSGLITMPSTLSSRSDGDESEQQYLSVGEASFSPSASHSLSHDFYFESTSMGGGGVDNDSPTILSAINANANASPGAAYSVAPSCSPSSSSSYLQTTTTASFTLEAVEPSSQILSRPAKDNYSTSAFSDENNLSSNQSRLKTNSPIIGNENRLMEKESNNDSDVVDIATLDSLRLQLSPVLLESDSLL